MVHLHVHTDASFLDGMILPDKLVARAKELGMPAVAVTDHGNMSNIVSFYKEAKKAGIKPILGCEVYIEEEKGNSHLVLLAKDMAGYRNLNRLVFMSYKNFYRKPRIKREWLKAYSSGLVALSACLGGVVIRAIREGRGEEEALWMKDVFGDDFYLEVQANKIPEQNEMNEKLYALSKKTGIPLVGTIDAHFLMKNDLEAHRTLLRIPGMKVSATYTEAYLKTREEMEEELPPEALDNTLLVADKCNVELDLSTKMPVFSDDQSELFRGALAELAPIRTPWTQEYRERLEYEVSVIEKMDYQGYFMVLYDVVTWAKSESILMSPGRGSAAGSLVSYVLGITDLDPIEHGLIFERFLNPDRVSLPDIDLDVPQDRRSEVLEYLRNKYGEEYVAKIMAMSKLKPKSAFKDVARVMNVPFKEANSVTSMIPDEAKTMEHAAKLSEDFKKYYDLHPDMMRVCESLIGVTRQATVHGAGVVISPVPILDVVTMKYDKEAGQVIAVDKDSVEYVGLVKMDFLGLETLSIIAKTGVDISGVDLEDPNILKMFRDGDTDAVFQFESDGMKRVLKESSVSSFNDIVAANALYRPGPIESGIVEEYISNKKSGKTEIPFEDLADVLGPTYGVLCYQEQVIECAVRIGGVSRSDGDILRKAIGKKDTRLMKKILTKVVAGAKKQGRDPVAVMDFFKKIEKFAHYSFNKSHSAAYSKLAVITAYLKFYYPAEFCAAAISVWAKKPEKVYHMILAARRAGLDVLPPDLNTAEEDAKPIGNYAVVLGLSSIKGIGQSAVKSIMENRPFIGLFDFMARAKQANIANTKALISAGAFSIWARRKEDLFFSADSFAKRLKNGAANKFIQMASGNTGLSQSMERSMETWTDKQKMAKEFNAFGFYLTKTPLDAYKSTIDDMVYGKLYVIENIRITRTKNKDEEMGIIQLTDYSVTEEKPIFPNMWEGVKHDIKVGSVVITKYDDNGYIVSIVPVDGQIDPSEIVIEISDDAGMTAVKGLVARYPGALPPRIMLNGEEVQSDISVKYDVVMMQLLNKIDGVSAKTVF